MLKRGARNNIKNKKAQVTLFVILGLVILLIIALLFFLLKKPAVKEEFREESVPEEFKPVQDYVEACIHQLGVEAVKKMGAHGGYINPLDLSLSPLRLRFSSSDPTYFELVSLTGEPEDAVPYYLHVSGSSDYLNYEFDSAAPTIESMEYQLGQYIERNLPVCTQGFEVLEEQGYQAISDDENISARAIINEESIEFFVEYHVEAIREDDDVKTRITMYNDVLRFPLLKYYNLAVGLMTAEGLTQFSESFTLSLINYYSGLDPNMLPPLVEYTNLPYVMTWSNSKARLDLNSLLLSYTPALQVENTKGFEPIELSGNGVEDAFYNSLVMDVFNTTIINLSRTEITFFYPDNTVRMRIQPSQGDIISPDVHVKKGNQNIPKSQFNTYKFYYDVAYPLVVEIRGEEPGTEIPEYSFFFALESNLIENKPVLAWQMGMGTVDWDPSYINTTITYPEGSITDEQGNPIDVKPQSLGKSLFCDEATWISGMVTLRAVDKATNKPLEQASVVYGCGDYDACWLGTTDASGIWKGNLPLCKGGVLTISKDGYGSKAIRLSTQEGKKVLIPTQKLYEYKEVNATVKKFEINKVYTRNSSWGWEEGDDSLGSLQEIDNSSEQVILIITQTGFEAGNAPLTNTILFGRQGVSTQAIKLVPGDYEVRADLIDYNGITIPANCSRVCAKKGLLGGCRNYTYYPESDVELETSPWGGLRLKPGTGTSVTGEFSISASELYNADSIEFRVFKLPDLSQSNPSGACLGALEEMNKVSDYSVKYKDEVWPVIK